MTLRYLTAGESHGKALIGILEGLPAGIPVSQDDFCALMKRRQNGYGRGPRAKSRVDKVEVLSGISGGYTIGSPVSLMIENLDFSNADHSMNPFKPSNEYQKCTVPLPGHADLAGAIKYRLDDFTLIRERASARESAMRVALSVIPRLFLKELGVASTCFVDSLAGVAAEVDFSDFPEKISRQTAANGDEFLTPDGSIIRHWKSIIDTAEHEGKSLGGSGSVIFWNLPAGIGSHVHADRRLDAIFASLVMSIPGVKSVEINGGNGSVIDQPPDSPFFSGNGAVCHRSNNCGGIEGGISNGEPLVIRFKMKPLPGKAGAESLDAISGESSMPALYRSDVCALPAASLLAESLLATSIASQILEMTGGYHLEVIRKRFAGLFCFSE